MSEHTPGPWKVRNPDGHIEHHLGDGRIERSLCTTRWIDALGGMTAATVSFGGTKSVEAFEADARLIAAAPDLLAALEDVAEVLHSLHPMWSDISGEDKEAAEEKSRVWKVIDAALAKARGEAEASNV